MFLFDHWISLESIYNKFGYLPPRFARNQERMWSFRQKVEWFQERLQLWLLGEPFVSASIQFESIFNCSFIFPFSFGVCSFMAGCFSATTCANQKYLSIRGSRDRWPSVCFQFALHQITSSASPGLWNSDLPFPVVPASLRSEEEAAWTLRDPSSGWVHGWSLPRSSVLIFRLMPKFLYFLSGLPPHWSSPKPGLVEPDLSKSLPWILTNKAPELHCFLPYAMIMMFLCQDGPKHRAVSLFSGICGLDLGLAPSGSHGLQLVWWIVCFTWLFSRPRFAESVAFAGA